jgi:hypothetical protein
MRELEEDKLGAEELWGPEMWEVEIGIGDSYGYGEGTDYEKEGLDRLEHVDVDEVVGTVSTYTLASVGVLMTDRQPLAISYSGEDVFRISNESLAEGKLSFSSGSSSDHSTTFSMNITPRRVQKTFLIAMPTPSKRSSRSRRSSPAPTYPSIVADELFRSTPSWHRVVYRDTGNHISMMQDHAVPIQMNYRQAKKKLIATLIREYST